MTDAWSHGKLTTNGIQLHYVTQGEGQLMLLLHGFPEFWYSWRHQIPEFARDHKVVALDLRGYNDSDRPQARSAYHMDELVKDIKGAIASLGYDRCILVGHDWGGAIAWQFVYRYPTQVDRLIILNLPHPAKFAQGLRTWRQLTRSWYILFFQLPRLPELLLQTNLHRVMENTFRGMAIDKSAFSDADIDAYTTALAKPGALTAALNYYRNLLPLLLSPTDWPILFQTRTLMIWGEKDVALGKELSEGTEDYVQDFQIHYIPDCSHWVQQEQPQLVNQYIREFLAG